MPCSLRDSHRLANGRTPKPRLSGHKKKVMICQLFFRFKQNVKSRTAVKMSPSTGVSIPHTNWSLHIICVWVPSSGIPSTKGISFFSPTLVFHKERRRPSWTQTQKHRILGINENTTFLAICERFKPSCFFPHWKLLFFLLRGGRGRGVYEPRHVARDECTSLAAGAHKMS